MSWQTLKVKNILYSVFFTPSLQISDLIFTVSTVVYININFRSLVKQHFVPVACLMSITLSLPNRTEIEFVLY